MTPAEATSSSIDWGLVVALVGVSINLIFNIVNFRRTTSLKKRDLRVEEFKRLRTRLDATLDELTAEARSLNALSRSAATAGPWGKALVVANKKLTEVDAKLRSITAELNASPFCKGADWHIIGDGDWDDAVSHLNGGYNTTLTLEERKAAVARTSAHLEKRVRAYNARVNKEMANYATPA